MTLDELKSIVKEIEYRDWFIKVAEDGESLYIQLIFDADGHKQRGRKWRISKHMIKDEIVYTVMKAALTAEEHEAREHFRYRGRRIFGPHIGVDALWDASKKIEVRK